MDNRYSAVPDTDCLEAFQDDQEFQAPDGTHIKSSLEDIEQNCLLKVLPVIDESVAKEEHNRKKKSLRNSPTVNPTLQVATRESLNLEDETNSVRESEAAERLQQAAHILATGAIRAAQRQKAALKEPHKDTNPNIPPMSGVRRSADIGCETAPKLPTEKALNASNTNRPIKKDAA